METKKLRFQDAQVGDDVYCRLRGEGIIKSITYSERYPLECLFFDDCTPFDYDGRSKKDHFEPTLFYRKYSEKYLTERPYPEVDWAKVPMNTQVFISDDETVNPQNAVSFFGYFPNLKSPFWIFIGVTEENAEGYKYCKLAEICKPEWRKK